MTDEMTDEKIVEQGVNSIHTIDTKNESALIINNEGMCHLLLHQPDDPKKPIPQAVLILSALAKKMQDEKFITDAVTEHIEELKRMIDKDIDGEAKPEPTDEK